jgi:hypothetical protein
MESRAHRTHGASTRFVLCPGAGWPDLHPNYQQMLKKLRATDLAEQSN